MADFLLNLSYETWESLFVGNGVNKIFSSFLSTFHMLFYLSFPLIQVDNVGNNNSWTTLGILISCYKRELCVESRNSKISSIIKYYKEYYKILSKAITRAKCLEYDKKKLKSSNKIKTTWEIICNESGRNIKNCGIQLLNVEGKNTEN